MTIAQFLALPPVLARQTGVSRCGLCGEVIRRAESVRDGGMYDKVHTTCIEFADGRVLPDAVVTFALRKSFLEARAAAGAGQ